MRGSKIPEEPFKGSGIVGSEGLELVSERTKSSEADVLSLSLSALCLVELSSMDSTSTIPFDKSSDCAIVSGARLGSVLARLVFEVDGGIEVY